MDYQEYKRRRMAAEWRQHETQRFAERYEKERAGKPPRRPVSYAEAWALSYILPLGGYALIAGLVHGNKTAWIVFVCLAAPYAVFLLVFCLRKLHFFLRKLYQWNLRYLGYRD